MAGYYEAGPGDTVFLSSRRNAYRPGGYSRWDVRADKAFLFQRFKPTLYGEAVNVLDRTNWRYTGLDELTRSRRCAWRATRSSPCFRPWGSRSTSDRPLPARRVLREAC